MSITLPYTFQELLVAIKHAEVRHYESRLLGLTQKNFGADTSNLLNALEIDTIGTISEMMVAKWLGKMELTCNTFKNKADVGDDVEVRTVRSQKHKLVLRPNDPPSRRYILTHTNRLCVTLLGWIEGFEGMVSEYAADPGGYGKSWFVPQEKLWDMENFQK